MHVAVVGGGISGLAGAYRLRQLLGTEAVITLVELDGRLGGKLRTVRLAGDAYDVGAEAFISRRPQARELMTEVGLAADLTHPTGARAGIMAGGALRRIPPRTFMGVPASADAVTEVLSAEGAAAVAAESDLAPLELAGGDVSVGALMRERLGTEVASRLVDPLLGGVYAGHADSLGLRATMPELAKALDAGQRTLVGAAATLLPTPPAPGATPNPVFGTLTGGLQTFVERLADAADVQVRSGLPVRALHRRQAGWRLEIGSAPNPEFLDADAVLLAVPAPAARKLLADHAPTAATALGGIEVASVGVIGLALPVDAPLPQASGILIGSGERHTDGTPFTAKAFTFSSRKWAHLAGGDHLLIRGSVGRAGETATLQRDDADLVAAVRADLAELTGVTDIPLDTVVQRWGGGMPQYGVGHLDLVDTIEGAVADLPGLAVAGAYLRGIGLPGCVTSADAAATRIAKALAGH
ncbi:MAG TPA: protoporphyrinogen oxidase [Pseudonocardiaceae bacterium]|jgi:oxygen-dependent protoporphyrinogen oxidase|nr:protoporphyrinogen oxidase [Pseudonocardiaceae bacterium]